MLQQAHAGRRVVRLKGGDPFVFGRGGEEIEFLRAHDIPFEVVPGITAAIACGALCGDSADPSRVRAVGAARDGALRRLDRHDRLGGARRAEKQTVALYMGVAGLGTIQARLVEHGRAPGTPVAIIENGSRPEQRVLVTTLRELESAGRAAAIKSPALVIVGEVAALAERLHWFGTKPVTWLSGRKGSLISAQSTVHSTSAKSERGRPGKYRYEPNAKSARSA